MPDRQSGVLATPDEDLVAQARGGDSSAREELFRRHYGIAYRVAFRLLGHEQDAFDALQDGFLKAVLHLGEFDGRSGFRTWLLRVVTNASLDLGRRRRRRLSVSLDQCDAEESTRHGVASGFRAERPLGRLDSRRPENDAQFRPRSTEPEHPVHLRAVRRSRTELQGNCRLPERPDRNRDEPNPLRPAEAAGPDAGTRRGRLIRSGGTWSES